MLKVKSSASVALKNFQLKAKVAAKAMERLAYEGLDKSPFLKTPGPNIIVYFRIFFYKKKKKKKKTIFF